MASLLTNNSAMVALQTLSQTGRDLQTTQNRISTGLRVADASDNAAYWAIASTMKSDLSALSAVKDSLSLGAATIDVASASLTATKDIVTQIKGKLVAAREPGVDRAKIQSEITALQSQLSEVASSASFNGQNWMSVDSSAANYNSTPSVVSSFTRDSSNAVSVGTISVNIADIALYDSNGPAGILDKDRTVGGTTDSIANLDVSALTDSAADLTVMDELISITDAALGDVIDAASDLGAAKMRINLQQTFISSITDAVQKGIGALIDADMNTESTRLQALQVQQQLGIQSLSIANQSNQMILKLFN